MPPFALVTDTAVRRGRRPLLHRRQELLRGGEDGAGQDRRGEANHVVELSNIICNLYHVCQLENINVVINLKVTVP